MVQHPHPTPSLPLCMQEHHSRTDITHLLAMWQIDYEGIHCKITYKKKKKTGLKLQYSSSMATLIPFLHLFKQDMQEITSPIINFVCEGF